VQLIDDKYEIVAKLGTGGQGRVYKARHAHLGAYYALKLIAEEIGDAPERVTRFRSEAQTMAKFRHENIVRVHNLITRDGRPYCLVLDFVDGPNLGEYLKQHGPLAPQDALEIARELASALEHAHGFRVWHRDVKPRNVLIESVQPWRVLLTDFGIAKIEDSVDRTQPGHLVGTTRYCAPEQLGYTRRRGDDRSPPAVDQRTDVFGLGLLLYEMLEGEQFFHGMDLADIVGWVYDADPQPVTLRRAGHPELERLVVRALSRDPAERHPTMTAMLHEIGRCQRLVGRPAYRAASTPDDSDELSDDKLDEEIQRLERERLRRQAQHARALLEAARGRAQDAGVPVFAPEALERAGRLQEEAQSALERSLYDRARELFESAVTALDQAAEAARRQADAVPRERVLVAREIAAAARKAAEMAGAQADALDTFAAAERLQASAEGHLDARRYPDAERDFEECRRSYETAAVAVRIRQLRHDENDTATRTLQPSRPLAEVPPASAAARAARATDDAPARRQSLVPYAVAGGLAILVAVTVTLWLGRTPSGPASTPSSPAVAPTVFEPDARPEPSPAGDLDVSPPATAPAAEAAAEAAQPTEAQAPPPAAVATPEPPAPEPAAPEIAAHPEPSPDRDVAPPASEPVVPAATEPPRVRRAPDVAPTRSRRSTVWRAKRDDAAPMPERPAPPPSGWEVRK
jgi:tRNA A-37 threonylcarbamoyl transferase component Bud32